MEPTRLTGAVRLGRGALATVALFLVAGWTLLALTFGCCSSPSLSQRLADPEVWCLFLTFPTPLAALPPLSRPLRATRWRWLFLPSVLASGALIAGLWDLMALDDPAALAWLVATALPLAVCGLYVLVRVVLARPATSA